MKAATIVTTGYILAAMTTGLALMILGSRTSGGFSPSVKNLGPSGTHAFERLLRDSGIKVVVSSENRPVLAKTDLGIMFDRTLDLEDTAPISDRARGTLNLENLKRQMRRGGVVVRARFDPSLINDFMTPDQAAVSRFGEPGKPLRGQRLLVSLDFSRISGVATTELAVPYCTTDTGAILCDLEPVGEGMFVNVADGIGMTNRMVDQLDNAKFYVGLVKGLLPPGGRVVILEAAAVPGTETSFMAATGAWAETAWRQFELLLAVVAITLGFTFGKRIRDIPPTGGTRDLLNAFGFLMERATKQDLAQRLIEHELNQRKRALRTREAAKAKPFEVLLEDAKNEKRLDTDRWNRVFAEMMDLERKPAKRSASVTESKG